MFRPFIPAQRVLCVLTIGVCLALTSERSAAYESDVHYGLTKWLALKAGFASHEAEAIARGNQRVDSGGPQPIDTVLDYGCALPDPAAALRVQRAHAPFPKNVPAEPTQRQVVPGSEAAKEQIQRVLQEGKGQESLMLSLFGAALHTYQDSWSHAGVPSVIDAGVSLKCDSNLAVSHPASRGGWDSHNADLTFAYAGEAVQMAKASYEVLMEVPSINGRQRSAGPWSDLEAEVRSFVSARTKTQKKAWFVAQGMPDVDLLGGITLPDGADTAFVRPRPSLLPELESNTSNQHEVAQDVKDFFDKLLATWVSDADLDKSMSEFLLPGSARRANQMRARLKLMKMHDHGTAAALVHKRGSLSASELRKVTALTRDGSAYVRVPSVADALLPLMTKGINASPLLPYITRDLAASVDESQRVIAIMRFKHLPYDSVGLVAERTASGWKLADVLIVVDQ